jgi:hypothetical protein
MNWEHARNTNRKAAETAEAGDIFTAVRIYIHGGSYSYSPKEHRKLEKAKRNSKPGQSHLGQYAVDARIFYTAYRRFFLPTLTKSKSGGG